MGMGEELALYDVDILLLYYSSQAAEKGNKSPGTDRIVLNEIFIAGDVKGFENDGMGVAAEDEDRNVPSFAHVPGEEGYVVFEAPMLERMYREYL